MVSSLKGKANSITDSFNEPLVSGSSMDIEKESSKKSRTKSSGSVVKDDSKKNRASFGSSKKDKAKSEGSAAGDDAPERPANLDNFKKLVYLFVARDSDMFVYENHIEPKIVAPKFTADIYKVITVY